MVLYNNNKKSIMRKILGIDPGLSGGLSIIDERFNLIACYPMPTVVGEDGKRKVDPVTAYNILSKHDIDLAMIEKVGARPKQGSVSTFNFGDGYGVIRSIAAVLFREVKFATAQDWRKYQGLIGLSKGQVAEIAYEVFQAEQIYAKPRAGKRAVRDGISDSLMIAKYGVRFLE